ncbi:YueI family protein [Schleiferilactobacillus shenzhenensis]|uniref:DUF1694 domain-containing protein n=1 Tax=Schleiferilactobacillus shenzhenensis LY-73 TaxID=1231336 RepID=U4TYR1_9LACO|nr:YueI family protein [Schleiferilactobacillus shenzhenensis]ERL66447.1 hypothetical protein L248_0126 [Schleiferilactobacillus shenzhenensis LY-73]
MANNDDVNQRIEESAAGGRQTNPDERRQYLGSLRERVFLAITVGQLPDPDVLTAFNAHLADFKGYSALINGKVDNSITGAYIKALSSGGIPFTLVNDTTTPSDNAAMGLLIVAKAAINEPTVAITAKYPDGAHSADPKEKKHKGFFDSLF